MFRYFERRQSIGEKNIKCCIAGSFPVEWVATVQPCNIVTFKRPTKDIQKYNKGNSKVQQRKFKRPTKKVSISFMKFMFCIQCNLFSYSRCIDLEIKENPVGSGSNIWTINPEKKRCLGLKYRFPMHCIAMGWAGGSH